jgi:hypothetical protein
MNTAAYPLPAEKLPEEHMRRACEWLRYMKSGSPRPESLIGTER